MKMRIFSTIMVTVFFVTSAAFADVDCAPYDEYNECNGRYFTCTCTQNQDGTVRKVQKDRNRSQSSSGTGYEYYSTYGEDKKLLKNESAFFYGGTDPASLDIREYKYDTRGRMSESTYMSYAYDYGYTDDIGSYAKSIYNYDSDEDTSYSSISSIHVTGDGGERGVVVTNHGKEMHFRNDFVLDNNSLEQIKSLVNSGNVEAILDLTDSRFSYYRPDMDSDAQSILTNNEGISYRAANYYDSERNIEAARVTEIYVPNADGSVDVYDVSELSLNGSYEEVAELMENINLTNLDGTTFKGKYNSIAKYFLTDVLDYVSPLQKIQNADGSTTIYNADGTIIGYENKRSYTPAEAAQIAGDTNTITLIYK